MPFPQHTLFPMPSARSYTNARKPHNWPQYLDITFLTNCRVITHLPSLKLLSRRDASSLAGTPLCIAQLVRMMVYHMLSVALKVCLQGFRLHATDLRRFQVDTA